MNCQETQTLIHGYLDGELDLMKSLEIEQHLQECSACARAHASFQAVRAAIKDGSLYLRPPAKLLKRIRSSVRKASDAGPAPGLIGRRLLAVAIGVIGLLVGWPIVRLYKSSPWRKRDPVAEAQERLRVAKVDAEAARLNREADSIYEKLYDESLAEEEAAPDAPPEEGKGHGGER